MSKSINVAIGIVLILALLAYAIFLYISYREQKWIFTSYEPPPLVGGFRPGGKPQKLTPQEIARRRSQITGT